MVRLNPIERRVERFLREPPSVRNAAGRRAPTELRRRSRRSSPSAAPTTGLEGTAFIAIVTAVITSTFVARATRDYEAARVEEDVSDRERLERRFDALERKLDVLVAAQDSPGAPR
jgi:hypothetical protein